MLLEHINILMGFNHSDLRADLDDENNSLRDLSNVISMNNLSTQFLIPPIFLFAVIYLGDRSRQQKRRYEQTLNWSVQQFRPLLVVVSFTISD